MNRETRQLDFNALTEMPNTEKLETSNRIETPSNSNRNTIHPNTTEQTLTQKVKRNVVITKGILPEKKTSPSFSQGRNSKNKRIINIYLNEEQHGIKRTNLYKSENSHWDYPQEHEQKFKTWMEN